jgi:hypothetical protein
LSFNYIYEEAGRAESTIINNASATDKDTTKCPDPIHANKRGVGLRRRMDLESKGGDEDYQFNVSVDNGQKSEGEPQNWHRYNPILPYTRADLQKGI